MVLILKFALFSVPTAKEGRKCWNQWFCSEFNFNCKIWKWYHATVTMDSKSACFLTVKLEITNTMSRNRPLDRPHQMLQNDSSTDHMIPSVTWVMRMNQPYAKVWTNVTAVRPFEIVEKKKERTTLYTTRDSNNEIYTFKHFAALVIISLSLRTLAFWFWFDLNNRFLFFLDCLWSHFLSEIIKSAFHFLLICFWEFRDTFLQRLITKESWEYRIDNEKAIAVTFNFVES